jgi:peptidoglycan/LPS O-acetylase OafA/YrhL/lysophospholipase L1-like esterase
VATTAVGGKLAGLRGDGAGTTSPPDSDGPAQGGGGRDGRGSGPGHPRPGRLGYLPALDGLRAVAVLGVLAFHQGFPRASGGFLGVSSFFTLSGFLIATLVLSEWATTGRLSLAHFWERRARRLLPAALAALATIVVLQATLHVGSGSGFRDDVLAAVGYGTNWRLAAGGGSYADLFASPSPLTHFWSLAIEEQFYLVFPLAFVGLMAVSGRVTVVRRRPLLAGAAFAGAAVASFVAAHLASAGGDNGGLAYYGTHTRAGELLVGVTLAFGYASATGGRVLRLPAVATAVRYGAPLALAGLLLIWHRTTLGDPRLFSGITAVNALLTAWVVLAATRPGGPIGLTLGSWPLRSLGKISYAAYLFHWPVYLVLDRTRLDVAPRTLFAARLVATLAAATLSTWALERPFRYGLRMSRPRLAAVLAGGAALVVAALTFLPQHPSGRLELDVAGDGLTNDRFALRAQDVVRVGDDVEPVARALAVGDSVAWSFLPGLSGWNDRHPDQQVGIDTHLAFGCPLSGPGQILAPRGRKHTVSDCATWLRDLPAAIERSQPDVVFIVMGLGDLGGRPVDGRWRDWGDPVFEEWMAARVDEVADALAEPGVPVLWLTFPPIRVVDADDPTASPDSIPLNEPHRVASLNRIIRAEADQRDGFRVIDLGAWMETWPEGPFDPEIRDGVHFTFAGSGRAGRWLAPQLAAAG